MKILFLVPPETISIESSVPKALEGGKGYYPKLGLMYVAAWYERATGNTPVFIDCPPEGITEHELLKQVEKVQPNMVAMSIMTFNLLDAPPHIRIAQTKTSKYQNLSWRTSCKYVSKRNPRSIKYRLCCFW